MINNHQGATLYRGICEVEKKEEVKNHILENHGDFFPNGKVFQKRKEGEFVYANIFELSDYWLNYWTDEQPCLHCGAIRTNLESKNQGVSTNFCSIECKNKYSELVSIAEDRECSSKKSYIYKITHKKSGKCYIGKTINHFIWRWWNHLKANTGTKFHEFLSEVDPEELTFEVLETLEGCSNEEILKKETEYIIKYDSINNGFNSMVSNKKVEYEIS